MTRDTDSTTPENKIPDNDYNPQIQDMKASPQKSIKSRFVKVHVVNYGKLPEWHQGFPYNGDAHIFVDEVDVK